MSGLHCDARLTFNLYLRFKVMLSMHFLP
jgi:hypothetical protein